MSKQIFQALLNGFYIPIGVMRSWITMSKGSKAHWGDDSSEPTDPIARLSNSDLMSVQEILKMESEVDMYTKDNLDAILSAFPSVVEALLHNFPGRQYVLFGRDCWPLSAYMYHCGIKHLYVEGASRHMVNEHPKFMKLMGSLPLEEGAVLLDTGYAGSIPSAYVRAHMLVESGTVPRYHIRLLSTTNHEYQLTRLDGASFEGIVSTMEASTKFFGSPREIDEEGYPILRLSSMCMDAAYTYVKIMELALKEPFNRLARLMKTVPPISEMEHIAKFLASKKGMHVHHKFDTLHLPRPFSQEEYGALYEAVGGPSMYLYAVYRTVTASEILEKAALRSELVDAWRGVALPRQYSTHELRSPRKERPHAVTYAKPMPPPLTSAPDSVLFTEPSWANEWS